MSLLEFVLIILLLMSCIFYAKQSNDLRQELHVIYDLYDNDKKTFEWYFENREKIKNIYYDKDKNLVVEHIKDWK